jgi:hypothetical protein
VRYSHDWDLWKEGWMDAWHDALTAYRRSKERQVLRVRELTNMTNEQISDIFIKELLQSFYPSETAEYLMKTSQKMEKSDDEKRQ